MTTTAFSREFDILYNNITSNAAAALDEYEKSLFLTRAQEELVIELYTGKSKEFSSFEVNEELRKYLDTLVKPIYINLVGYVPPGDNNAISEAWSGTDPIYNYRIDLITRGYTDILYTIYESAKLNATFLPPGYAEANIESLDVEVKSIKHTEYHSIIRNPFKRQNQNRVLRVDSSLSGASLYDIELLSFAELQNYKQRYVKVPRPIILINLAPLSLDINGITAITQCELPPIIHNAILKRAVDNAAQAYKSS